MMKQSLTSFAPSQLLMIPAGKQGTAFTPYALLIIGVLCVIQFIVSVLQERGVKIRESLAKLPLPVTAAIYFCMLVSIDVYKRQVSVCGKRKMRVSNDSHFFF